MQKRDMTPIKIKIEMMRHSASQVGIARQCEVTQGHVHRVISGQSISDRVQRVIAESINKPVEQVFPSRYPLRGKVVSRPEQCAAQAAG